MPGGNYKSWLNRRRRRLGHGLGLALSLTAVLLSLGAADTPAGEFYPLMNSVMARMHVAMHVAPSGDVDRDFARMMLAHHTGAIDMALLELRFGKDERLRRLACPDSKRC
jgi:hypothetical protein